MGCDIHLYKEKQIAGNWVSADEWEARDYGEEGMQVPWEKQFTDRNYALFGVLCKGVRREIPFSFEPRGVPFSISQEVKDEVFRWNGDGHSHSYLYLHELVDLQRYLEYATITVSGMKDKVGLAKLRASIASGTPDWGLLYPYCGWTNTPGYEEFSIDMPASTIIGDGVEKIIRSFDGVDGDNHRIVFFFDN